MKKSHIYKIKSFSPEKLFSMYLSNPLDPSFNRNVKNSEKEKMTDNQSNSFDISLV